MSLEFTEGFSLYGSSTSTYMARYWSGAWDGQSYPVSSGGRYSGGYFKLHWNSTIVYRPVSATQVKVWGSAVNFQGATGFGTYQFMAFRDSGTIQVDLRLNNSGQILVTRNGTTLGTSTNTITSGTWYYIELMVSIGSSGSYTLRVTSPGGIPSVWLTGTSVNTQNTGNATTNEVALMGNANNSSDIWLCDMYCLNNSGTTNNGFLGDCRVFTQVPNADGATTSWTTSTGTTHYSLVNETPPNDDTNYNLSATPTQIDLYKFPAITTTGTVAGVGIKVCARKDDAGARTIAVEYRSSAGNTYQGGTSYNPTSAYTYFSQYYDTDPDTGSAWTTTATGGTSGGQFGINCVA